MANGPRRAAPFSNRCARRYGQTLAIIRTLSTPR
jgi:hypothetical protein